jgi:Flp pilus assembly protein TadG
MRRRGRSDRGSVTTEFVVLTPVLLSFLCLVILTGRMVDARSDIIGAANDAARVASLQLSQGAAEAQAQAAAANAVEGERLNCSGGPQVQVDPDPAFERGAIVEVTISCTVNLSDLAFIGVPGTLTIEEQAWESIDQHRSEAP